MIKLLNYSFYQSLRQPEHQSAQSLLTQSFTRSLLIWLILLWYWKDQKDHFTRPCRRQPKPLNEYICSASDRTMLLLPLVHVILFSKLPPSIRLNFAPVLVTSTYFSMHRLLGYPVDYTKWIVSCCNDFLRRQSSLWVHGAWIWKFLLFKKSDKIWLENS